MADIDSAGEAETLDALTRRVQEARFTLQRRANAELIALYWLIGRSIVEREAEGDTDGAIVAQFAEDLRTEFPAMRGFCSADVHHMRTFAAEWPGRGGIFQQPVGQLPWPHVVALLDRLDDQGLREWYAGKAIEHTWSCDTLVEHISARLHESDGAAPGNFAAALSRVDSDLAHEISNDLHTRDFLALVIDRVGASAR
ncbi:DUF1016 N-terminal domain-containing protein [Microbacterium sp. BK668]|uniref:DUF1016 N-terminal domain-containing protein n=1 Tax=Microbacterium sp. BK668 TaxID=2512118 RepID=UPI001414D0A1|nr:DUF1016 N-terminal domain-containing protein [Microbacterium sp. BK668]